MLEEYIKDAIDDEMKDYLTTETYKQQGEEIEKLLYSLRSELTPDQVSTLNRLVNVLDNNIVILLPPPIFVVL